VGERHFAGDCAIRRALSVTDDADAELLERFVTSQDEAAFAALMARHGPMAFGVCRRLLHHLEGDTLTICYRNANHKERPKEFESQEGSRTILMVFNRIKK